MEPSAKRVRREETHPPVLQRLYTLELKVYGLETTLSSMIAGLETTEKKMEVLIESIHARFNEKGLLLSYIS